MDFQTRKNMKEKMAFGALRLFSFSIIAILFFILGYIVINGISVVSFDFLTKMPEDGMTKGGILPAIIGTLCLMVVSLAIAFPIGVFSGIYLNEYIKDGWFKRFINLMTNNLSGIPSIVFGLFGMQFFVNQLGWGDSIIAGSFTLAILVLPVIIRTTEESLKAVSNTFREAASGLGASKWQTTYSVVLPIGMPNILTGLILSMSRVSGETAPILFTVAAYFLPQLPHSIFDQVMALPYHLYVVATSGNNITESRPIAFGTALVLIFIVLVLNLLANWLRKVLGSKVKMN
ncbi:MAG: phosphate ABC transporter permease PstA [Bacteroidia bacterium]|nr:phosphate ABC transporter permease PstA [Bacteroidia bacterium]